LGGAVGRSGKSAGRAFRIALFNLEEAMPIRTATLRHKLEHNGAMLHVAMAMRAQSRGADAPPTEQEQALLDERRALKEERAKRQAQARAPKVKPVRVAKEAKPKAVKAPKPVKEDKAAKDHAKDAKEKPHHKGPHLSRTELHAKKAEALKAAEAAAKKSAAAKKTAKS
jgi:hypothetical protein